MSALVLDGKAVLVTGGSGRLGSALAHGMAAAGADVVITGRSLDRLQTVADKVQTSTGRTVRCVAGDLTHRAALSDLSGGVWDAFGRLDAVVNSAVPDGSQLPAGDLLGTSDELWWQYFDPIVLGALGLARGLVPRMAEQGGGAFINLSSPTGVSPVPGMDAYGLAKGALLLLTKYMAREWGRWRIRANALLPGLILDDQYITEDSIAAQPALKMLLDRTSLGRAGHAEELVGVAVFLASDASAFVSGQALAVDGGRF